MQINEKEIRQNMYELTQLLYEIYDSFEESKYQYQEEMENEDIEYEIEDFIHKGNFSIADQECYLELRRKIFFDSLKDEKYKKYWKAVQKMEDQLFRDYNWDLFLDYKDYEKKYKKIHQKIEKRIWELEEEYEVLLKEVKEDYNKDLEEIFQQFYQNKYDMIQSNISNLIALEEEEYKDYWRNFANLERKYFTEEEFEEIFENTMIEKQE